MKRVNNPTWSLMRLIVESLSQVRGERRVLDGVSFTVSAGEALILTGPNGAGKTTLLRTLAGLLPAVAGKMTLEGGDPEATVGEQAHLIGHANAIKPGLSVAENIRFWATYLTGVSPSAAPVDAALTALDLTELAAIPAAYLSAGQKRRVGLARLLAAPRALWLLDEPTVSLDAANRDRLAALVRTHINGGGMVVAATHLPLGIEGARELALTGGK